MRRHFRRLAVRIKLRVLGGHSNDLMILLAGVNHGHQADGASMDDGKGHNGFLAQHQHVERVVVFGERLRYEAVIRRIVNRRVEDAIKPDQAARFVEFIFHARAKRNFDHAVEFLRQLVAGSYVVPRMNHERYSQA